MMFEPPRSSRRCPPWYEEPLLPLGSCCGPAEPDPRKALGGPGSGADRPAVGASNHDRGRPRRQLIALLVRGPLLRRMLDVDEERREVRGVGEPRDLAPDRAGQERKERRVRGSTQYIALFPKTPTLAGEIDMSVCTHSRFCGSASRPSSFRRVADDVAIQVRLRQGRVACEQHERPLEHRRVRPIALLLPSDDVPMPVDGPRIGGSVTWRPCW